MVALEPVLIVGDAGERRPALPAFDRRIFGLKPVEMVHRQRFDDRQELGRIFAKRVLGLPLERVVGELVDFAQVVARDRVERRQVMLGRRLLRLVMLVAEQVAEPVGVAQVAAVQRLQRVALERRLVALLEQLEQPLVRARLRLCSCGDLRRGRRGAGEGQQRCGQDQRALGEEVHSAAFSVRSSSGR